MKKEMIEMIEIAVKPKNIKESDYNKVVDCLTENTKIVFENNEYLIVIVHQGTEAFEKMKALMLLKAEFEISYCKVDSEGYFYYKEN